MKYYKTNMAAKLADSDSKRRSLSLSRARLNACISDSKNAETHHHYGVGRPGNMLCL